MESVEFYPMMDWYSPQSLIDVKLYEVGYCKVVNMRTTPKYVGKIEASLGYLWQKDKIISHSLPWQWVYQNFLIWSKKVEFS